MSYPFIVTGDAISVVLDDRTYTIGSSHPNFSDVAEAIKDQQWDLIPALIDIPKAINQWAQGVVEIVGNQVFYQGEVVVNALADHIMEMISQGFSVDPLKNFLIKLMANPSYRSREQLFGFVEANQITITPDGDLLLYKKVRSNFTDIYTGKFNNNIGQVVEMPRSKVDDDPNRTCSEGLHVCSLGYLDHFGGASDPVVLVKVDPADVVSVPTDYNNTKMRVAKYEVVAQHQGGSARPAFNDRVANPEDYLEYDEEHTEDDGVPF
jgi:hypothetical protein